MPLPNARKKRRTSEAAFYMCVCVCARVSASLFARKKANARSPAEVRKTIAALALASSPSPGCAVSLHPVWITIIRGKERASSIVAGNYFIIVCSFALFTRLRFFSRSAGSSIYTSARAREGGRIFCHPHPRPLYPREMKGLRAVFAPASVHVCIYIYSVGGRMKFDVRNLSRGGVLGIHTSARLIFTIVGRIFRWIGCWGSGERVWFLWNVYDGRWVDKLFDVTLIIR